MASPSPISTRARARFIVISESAEGADHILVPLIDLAKDDINARQLEQALRHVQSRVAGGIFRGRLTSTWMSWAGREPCSMVGREFRLDGRSLAGARRSRESVG
jgi:hypothetical protein